MAGHPKGIPSPGSGRKKRDTNTRQIQQTLNEAAVVAAKLFRDSIRGKDEKGHKVSQLSMTRLKTFELAIAHAVGTPRQKIELRHSGVFTLQELAEIAYAAEPTASVLAPVPEKEAGGEAALG